MKALTLWQPWASLVVIGAKPFEFRTWPTPRVFQGCELVIHAAKRPIDMVEVRALCAQLGGSRDGTALTVDVARSFLERLREAMKRGDQEAMCPTACGVGTAELGKPIRCVDLYPGDPSIDEDKWAWPMLRPTAWPQPIYHRGAQGFWDWDPKAVGSLI